MYFGTSFSNTPSLFHSDCRCCDCGYVYVYSYGYLFGLFARASIVVVFQPLGASVFPFLCYDIVFAPLDDVADSL